MKGFRSYIPKTWTLVVFLFVSLIGQSIAAQVKESKYINRFIIIRPQGEPNAPREETNDAQALKNSLTVAGFAVAEASCKKIAAIHLENYDVIVIPYATAKSLSSADRELLAAAVKSGTNIIFDGISELNQTFKIWFEKDTVEVTQIRDMNVPSQKLYWTRPCQIKPINNQEKSFQPLCVDDTTGASIAVSGTFGKGKLIYFAPLFDPYTVQGYSRFPFLMEAIQNIFNIKPTASRAVVEMYFDPGMRPDSIPMDTLAKFWRKNNIKRIFAGGWYYDTDYDYESLLKSCHENGIVVYCWFETPMISLNFWDKHPEWREKTPFQRDAQIDWRSLINLADSNCRKQVFKEMGEFLLKYDWDGVDFAELYFEPSPVGPELPQNFTPMNSVVRDEFKKLGGFDPVLLFDPQSTHYWKTHHADWLTFAAYRKELLFRLKKQFLDFFTTIKNKKTDFEIMLTVLDVSITPQLSNYIGEDTEHSLWLYKHYDISLQVEDPSNCWGLTPERYDKMGKFYRKAVKNQNDLIFDCNVVSAHEKGEGGFASEIPSGEEIRQVAYQMDLHNVRPAFYSEDVVSESDYQNLGHVLARKTRIVAKDSNLWEIDALNTIMANVGIQRYSIKLDNQNWFAGAEDFTIIPKGKHTLQFMPLQNAGNVARLKKISGELIWARFSDPWVDLEYSEDRVPCYVIFDQKPWHIKIDGITTDCEVYSGNDKEYCIKLPCGNHKVNIRFGD